LIAVLGLAGLQFTGFSPLQEVRETNEGDNSVGNEEEKPQYQDYSGFEDNATNYMENQVDRKLNSINCEPSKVSYNSVNSSQTVCFPCGGYDACFPYKKVSRQEGQKLNPGGRSYLKGDYSSRVHMSFQTYGVSPALGCRQAGENYECDSGFSLVDAQYGAYFLPPEGMTELRAVKFMASELEERVCQFDEFRSHSEFECGPLKGIIQKGQITINAYENS
jgi:hypothetical protein